MAYVAGARRINYWAQLAPIYDELGRSLPQQPLLVPRARFRCLEELPRAAGQAAPAGRGRRTPTRGRQFRRRSRLASRAATLADELPQLRRELLGSLAVPWPGSLDASRGSPMRLSAPRSPSSATLIACCAATNAWATSAIRSCVSASIACSAPVSAGRPARASLQPALLPGPLRPLGLQRRVLASLRERDPTHRRPQPGLWGVCPSLDDRAPAAHRPDLLSDDGRQRCDRQRIGLALLDRGHEVHFICADVPERPTAVDGQRRSPATRHARLHMHLVEVEGICCRIWAAIRCRWPPDLPR